MRCILCKEETRDPCPCLDNMVNLIDGKSIDIETSIDTGYGDHDGEFTFNGEDAGLYVFDQDGGEREYEVYDLEGAAGWIIEHGYSDFVRGYLLTKTFGERITK